MGSSADTHSLVHGAMWLSSQTQPCCSLVLPSGPAMGCRADRELKVGADGCCCPLQPLGLHQLMEGKGRGGRVGVRWGFGAWQGGHLLRGERQLSQLCLVGVRRGTPAPPSKSRGPGVASSSSRAATPARPEK